MAVGTGIGINLDALNKAFEKADEHLQKLTDETNGLQKATISAFQQMVKGGVLPYVESLKQQKKYLEEIANSKGKGAFFKTMQKEAKAAVDEINKVISSLEKTKAFRNEQSGKNAISFANSVLGKKGEEKSLDNMRLALSKLEEAQHRQNLNTKRGRENYEKIGRAIINIKYELDKATGASQRLTNESQKIKTSFSTLSQVAATIFSVQSIVGYVNKLIEVRGEFELQHKSLQVLIGDIDKANELWDKTVALAVKSPFRVKDLVTYTKQLAAYRVEADKLYDTNKMLADVSAGLGVDMNRLILAFGQVKAANFLRGTELRQFSEAGVNLLEELSKRYTELEGRMVSVGEVFERVSKRMVSFSDVEAVFKTITSEGGSFYRMQEKQSETLRGMVMNLKDSIDLMFNEIGESNEGLLKGAIERVRNLVDNWQKFVTVLQEIGVAFVALKLPVVVKSLGALGTSAYVTSVNITKAGLSTAIFGKGIQRLTVGITSLTRALLKNPLFISGAIGAAILSVVHQFMRHNKEIAELNKKYDELSMRESNRLKKLQDLSEKAKEYNNTISENEEILSKSSQGTEEYANAEQKLADARKSNKQLLESIKKDYPQIYDSIKKNTDGTIDLNAAIEAQNKLLVANIALNEQAKGGTFFDDVATNAKEATVALVNQYNAFEAFKNAVVSKETNLIGLREVGEISEEQFEKLSGYLKQLSSVQSASEVNTILGAMANELRGNRDAFNAIIKPIENAKNAWAGFGLAAATTWDNLKGNLDRMYPSLMHFVNTAKQFTPDTWRQEAARNISASLDAFGIVDENLLAKVRDYIESMEGIGELTWELPKPEYSEADLKDWRKVIWDAIKDVNESLGDDLGQNKVVISLQDMIELDKENIFKNLSEQVSTAAKNIDDTIEAGLIPTQERFSQAQLDAAKSTKPLIKSLSDLLAIIEKSSSGSGEDKVLEKLRNRISLIKEMNKEYEKLNKTFSKAESLAKVQKAYADTAKELDLDTSAMDFTDEGTIKSLEALLGKPEYAANKYVIELQKALDNFKVELGVEVKQESDKDLKRQIEDLFDQYDLSLELKKLNIPSDLAKNLFNIDTTSLDELRNKLASMEGEFVGKDMEKQYKEYLAKIDEMEQKAQEERLKTYVEYARKAIGERAKIKLEELRKLKEIEETFEEKEGDSEETRQYKRNMAKDASTQVKKEADQELKRLDWQEFEKSDMFVNLFKDLEGASDSLLNHAINKLQMFKEEWKDMPLEDVRQIVEKMNELEDALINIQPIQQMKEAKKKVEDAIAEAQMDTSHYFESSDAREKFGDGKKKGAFMQAIQEESVYQEQQKADAQEQITYIETALRLLEGKATANDKLLQDEEEIQAYMKLGEQALRGQLTRQNGIITNADKILARNEDIVDANQDYNKGLNKVADYMDDAIGMANDLYEAFKDLSVALGADEDSPAMIFADMGMSIMSSIPQMLSLIATIHTATTAAQGLGMAMNMAMGIVGLIVMAIQLVTAGIKAIAKINDDKIVAQLDEQAKLIERQRDIYEQIEERVEKAYSVGQLEAYNKELERSVDLEIQALEASIALEKSRKKSDEEQIATWEKEILDARKRLAESTQEMMEEMGGIFDLTDFASGFVDAWWDAMEEGKSGLDALSEHFDETMADMVKKQALYKGASKIMEQLQKAINAGLEEDYSIDQAEWDTIVEAANKANIDLDKFLEGYRALFGELSLGGEGGLSGLTKGIQGITEDTAQIIEAYLNSIRAYTSEQVEYTKKIYNMFYAMTTGTVNGLNVRLIS